MTKQELRAKWIAALRSGEYKQTSGCLYDGEGYCCLGVACKVMGLEPKPFVNSEGKMKWYFDDMNAVLPPDVMNAFGFRTSSGEFDDKYVDNDLTALNDKENLSFERIADIVEKNPPGLWRDEP